MRQDLFARAIPAKVFFSINNDSDSYLNKITRKTGVTFAHINILVKKFVKWGLVTKEKKDWIVKLTLTKKGKEISDRLKGLHKAIGRIQNV